MSTICFEAYKLTTTPYFAPGTDNRNCADQTTAGSIKELRIRSNFALPDAYALLDNQTVGGFTWIGNTITIPINRTFLNHVNLSFVVCLVAPVSFVKMHQSLRQREAYHYNVTLPRGEGRCIQPTDGSTLPDCIYHMENWEFDYAFIPATNASLPCCPVCKDSYFNWYLITNTSSICQNGTVDNTTDVSCTLTGSFSTCPVIKRGLTGYNCYRGATTTCGLQIPTGTLPFNPTYQSMMNTFGNKNTASAACFSACSNTLTYNWCTKNQTRAYDYCC
ncbi:hypothetical protein HYH03_016685 [Edaphochlamys debaryana]|uniref:Uncharacterized protein n=1 Tax=Edaphochlamys debaryana TaxID=47281 RepID=A0A835XP96_9CHLO|nr:hypothetical protein HYH03_016685 [Edaphochlamys debaryana]|eukprot:KAG2484550.1 hypothetical protein HYH03_016685 [Edaphochlamys debaryana]